MRIGIHTGTVVVGEMGGGGQHRHPATGETVNMAARLAGLAAPNTVLMRQVTARLVQGAFALEDWGSQMRKGVADPSGVFRVLGPTVVAGVLFLVARDEDMGWLVRHWEQSQGCLGQAVLGLRQALWARRGRRQVMLGVSGGFVPEQTPCGMLMV